MTKDSVVAAVIRETSSTRDAGPTHDRSATRDAGWNRNTTRTARPLVARLHFYAGVLVAPFLVVAAAAHRG